MPSKYGRKKKTKTRHDSQKDFVVLQDKTPPGHCPFCGKPNRGKYAKCKIFGPH